MKTVEDYIEILANMRETKEGVSFKIATSDYNLVTSLARQTIRGIAFTDRQLELAKRKIIDYTDQFELNGYTNLILDEVRLPIRNIDRSKWIKIVEHPKDIKYVIEDDSQWIGIRFIFNKKLISIIEELRKIDKDVVYDRENKIHYFKYTDSKLFAIMNAFEGKNFDIDEQVREQYEILKMMNNKKENYIPGVYGLKLKNLNDKAIKFLIDDIGELTKDNLALYADRKDLYGLDHFDTQDLNESINNLTTLSQKIIRRNSNQVLVNSETYNIDRVVETLLELNRFPTLVVLNEQSPINGLHNFNNSIKNIFFNESSSVLFRLDNDKEENIEFNQYIKDNNLNSSLDISTKIVYITNNNINKTLLNSEWKPKTAIIMDSVRLHPRVQSFVEELDLVVHFDTDTSPFANRGIHKL